MHKTKFIMLAIFILMPFYSVQACNVRPYALSYINQINKALGDVRPKLAIESGESNDYVGFYNDGIIHIYKGDYTGRCSDETAYLKSIISHEYAHHATKELQKVTKLKGEKLAYVAEHSIGDAIFGDDIVYHNDADFAHPKAYEAIKNFILSKQNKNTYAKSETGTVYFKNRK